MDLEEEEEEVQLPGVDQVDIDHVKIPGVDSAEGLANQTPQVVEIDDPNIPKPDPDTIEAEPLAEEAVEVPAEPVEPATEEQPAPELRRSTRVRTQASQGYVPSMTGSRYSYAVAQLEEQGVINPDAHMFMQEDFYQAEHDIVAHIMMQLSLKVGLREWGDKAFNATHSEMKQLHF